MSKSKNILNRDIIQLICALSAKSFNKLAAHLTSPSKGANKASQILKIIREKIIEANAEEVSPEEFYQWIFGKSTYNAASLSTTLNRFKNAVYEFMMLEGIKTDPLSIPKYTLKGIHLHAPGWNAEKIRGGFEEKYFPEPLNSMQSFLSKYEFLEALAPFYAMSYQGFSDEYFQELYQNLSLFFQAKQLLLGTSLATQNIKHNRNMEFPNFDQILELCETGLEEKPDLLQACYHSMLVYCSSQAAHHFIALKKVVLRQTLKEDSLAYQDYRSFYTTLLNYSMLELDKGNLFFQATAEEIIDYGISSGLICIEEKIHYRFLKNALTVKCRIGKIEEAKQILSSYKGKIHGENEEVSAIHSGLILFYEKDYTGCMDLLEDIDKIEDKHFDYDRRILIILSMVMRDSLSDNNSIYKAIAAFDRQLRRDKSFFYAKLYINFLRVLRDFYNARQLSRTEKDSVIAKLKENVIEGREIPNKQLLLDLLEGNH